MVSCCLAAASHFRTFLVAVRHRVHLTKPQIFTASEDLEFTPGLWLVTLETSLLVSNLKTYR